MSYKDWTRCRLGDICKINQLSYTAKDDWSLVNYLDTGNITKNQISDIQCFDPKTQSIPSRAKRKVQINDIIYSTVRPNQRHYGIIRDMPNNMIVSTGFTVLSTIKDKAYSEFIYFYLTQDNIIESFQAIGEQSVSTYPSIKPSDIENLVLKLPPFSEQIRIANILIAFEKKIFLNNRINDNLYD